MTSAPPLCEAPGIEAFRAPMPPGARVIDVAGVDALIHALARDHQVVGPTVRDGSIVLDEIDGVDRLPAGWTLEQGAAISRLARRPDEALFGFATGPQSPKRWLLPPRVRLWRAAADGDTLTIEEEPLPPRPLALVGIRPCDLHAIAIQDRVLLGGVYVDRDYAGRRDDAFLVVVQCCEPGGTCFCSSTGTGPAAQSGFDLALTELLEGGHRFLAVPGSERGATLLASLPGEAATAAEVEAAARVTRDAAARMGRSLDTEGLPELLRRTLESLRYDEVAERCLSCGNCTMVCPTCFCTSIEEVDDLADGSTARERTWDTCFSIDHSAIHGGAVRRSPRARYRQWLTHKFGTWVDQFDTSGCVGCGRCITWCPVGIDVTEELAMIRIEDGRHAHADD